MAISDKHFEFTNRLGEWEQMTDSYEGERAIKMKRLDYLPATEAMVQDGMTTSSSPGWKDYEGYLLRAYYHNYVRDAVQAMMGIIHAKDAVIEVPERMKPLLDSMTNKGENSQALLRRINVGQLVQGRLGMLVEAPTGMTVDKALPYVVLYDATRVINWDTGQLNEGRNVLQLVVLDESGYRRVGFTWKTEMKYRVLVRGIPDNLDDSTETPPDDAEYSYCIKVNSSATPTADEFQTPQIGGNTMEEIPFIFINPNDLVPECDVSPLLTLSNLALAIYRAEADHRQTLYMQGQQTMVLIGMGEADDDDDGTPLRVGNKGLIRMKQGSDAKYIGVSAAGLSEMRESLKEDRERAAMDGAQFLDTGNAQGESGEALRVRTAARTTTLQTISRTGGAALEAALKYAATWMGEDPDEVTVKPNIDFADQSVNGAVMLAFMQAKQLGLPLSLESLHRMMASNDMTEMTYDEETDEIEAEAESMLGSIANPMAGMQGQTGADDSFLDQDDPAAPQPGQPPGGPAGPAGPANTPVTPHVRGSPTPQKMKLGPKGATANKKNGKAK